MSVKIPNKISNITRFILSWLLIVSLVFQGQIFNPHLVYGATSVTQDNPISFTVTTAVNNTVPNNVKYSIAVNNVFDNGTIRYKTIFLTYPKELKLVPFTPTGYVVNVSQSNGAATIVILNDGDTANVLTPAKVKTTLENSYFVLNEPNVFPGNGSAIGISANPSKISFHTDERGYMHYYQFFQSGNTWLQAYNLAKSKSFQDPFTGKVLKGYLATITSEEEQRMIYNSIATLCGWLGGTRLVTPTTYNKLQDLDTVSENIGTYYYSNVTYANQWYWACGPEAWTTSASGTPPYTYMPKNTASSTPLVFWNSATYTANKVPVTNVYQAFTNPTTISVKTNTQLTSGDEPNNSTSNEYVLQFAFNQDTWNDYLNTVGTYVKGYYVEFGGYPGDPMKSDLESGTNENTMVKISMPVTVLHRSTEMENDTYKEIGGIGKTLDQTLLDSMDDVFSAAPMENTPTGYVFAGYEFVGTDTDKANTTMDANGVVNGKYSNQDQTIIMLYKIDKTFTLTIDANEEKKYKPDFPVTAAKIRTISTIQVDSDQVQYMMLPTTDTTPITSREVFEAKAATIEDRYKGVMHPTGAGTYEYNMFSNNDPNLNGVLENCRLVVMATGTSTLDNTPVVAIDSHIFTNIYTPIDVFYKGDMTSGSALYPKTRVGIGNDLEAKYGIPLDLDGSVITDPVKGYDTIDVVHKDLEPLWTFRSSAQNDIQPFTLKDKAAQDQVFTFQYDKNTANWFGATFQFEDNLSTPTALAPAMVIDEFIANDAGNTSYMLGLDLYTPPIIDNYDPIGYKIDNGNLVRMSFPLKYGEIVLTNPNQTVTIVYSQNQIRVREEYHLFETDENGVEIDKGPIGAFSANTSSIDNGNAFTGVPPHLEGYVYRGYAVDNDLHYLTSPQYPSDPYNIVPNITPVSDTTIIYKYKADATHTGFADEDVKQIVVTATGMDAQAKVYTLYTKPVEKRLVGSIFEPSPLTTTDADGNTSYVDQNGNTVLVDKEGVHWILSKHPDLYSVDPFTVTDNRVVKFIYYKDSSGNGIPDYLEANVRLQYWDEANQKALLPDYLVSQYTATDSFSSSAPILSGYIAVGVRIYKEDEPEATPVYTDGIVKGEIPLLGANNWIMQFLYEPDADNDGIPDTDEAKITVQIMYELANGQTETTETAHIGRHGEKLYLFADSLNKDANKFVYAGGLTSSNAIYLYDYLHPYTVTVIFKEKEVAVEKEKRKDYEKDIIDINDNRVGNDTPVPPTNPIPNPTPSPKPTPPPVEKDEDQKGDNNKPTPIFEQPEQIFLDGELIPLNHLVYNGPYLYGYPNQTVGPDKTLTRAEAAQIIYNLYGQPEQFVDTAESLPYKDVKDSAWYAKAIAFTTQYGIVSGYPDGMFYPDKPITRAELVTLLVKFEDMDASGEDETIFNDIADHWAKRQILIAYHAQLVSGFPDGTFQPNAPTTRSEAVTIINTMMKRPERWIGEDEYTDLSEKDWAYKQLMNATNGYTEE